MSVRPDDSASPLALFGVGGELVSLRIVVEPKLLEDLLETLSSLDFPVNPQLYHQLAQVAVEFPAYAPQVDKVRDALLAAGFNPESLGISPMLTMAQGA